MNLVWTGGIKGTDDSPMDGTYPQMDELVRQLWKHDQGKSFQKGPFGIGRVAYFGRRRP